METESMILFYYSSLCMVHSEKRTVVNGGSFFV
nr:MAG TPA: hypothetical protein [Caudoviricetes sp.]